MTRTNITDEFAVLQRESQRALAVLRDVMAELEGDLEPRHGAQPKIAPVVHQPSVITYSRNS
jgi:hypothetical protein